MATEAIETLSDRSHERVYNALRLLLLIAKAGETQPLVQTIEEHWNIDIRPAAGQALIPKPPV